MKRLSVLTAALCAALLFSACSAPGQTPVAVSDPVSVSSSSAPDPVSAALDACDYAYHDYTEEFVAEHPDPVQLNNGLEGVPDYYKIYVQPDEACMEVQQAVNTAAHWMEAASGIPLGEYQFTTYAFRRTDYQNGERTIWSVDCWQAPDGTDEGSFHFIALLDAINGQLLSLNVKPPLNSGLYASDSSDSLELFQVMLPALFEEMGLPTVEAVKPAGDSGGGFLPVQISTASGDYRAAYMVSENTAQLTFLALDGAFLL